MERINRTTYRRGVAIAWRLIWPLLRQALGWFFILLGLLGLVLPVLQGVLFLVIGVTLVGRRNWLIRRSMLIFKRGLRRWAAARAPLVGAAGRIALRAQWKCSRESRHLHRRYAEWRLRRVRSHADGFIGDISDATCEGGSDRV
jgi:uncharacterized membrane protein YbaN (DUF454 family)